MPFFLTYATRPARLFLLIVFAASLMWCGDLACLSGSSDDHCASVICSLLDNHKGPTDNQTSPAPAKCICVCHMPTILGSAPDTEQLLTALLMRIEYTAFVPSSPAVSIYHPPRS